MGNAKIIISTDVLPNSYSARGVLKRDPAKTNGTLLEELTSRKSAPVGIKDYPSLGRTEQLF